MRSPVVTIAGAMAFMFTGLAAATGGIQEYDGTSNKTTTFGYNASGTATTMNVTTVPNFAVRNDLLVNGWSLMLFLSGIAGLFYGATLRPVERA